MYGRRFWSTLLVGAVACSAEPAEEAPQGAAAVDSVAMAQAQFEAAGFDTIQWDEPEDAVVRGSVVFSYSCSRCHGRQGFGDGGFVTGGDTLRPPSFHKREWKYAADFEGLRELIYTGTAHAMPHWGLEGLAYRDVDAVTHFILEDLRGGS